MLRRALVVLSPLLLIGWGVAALGGAALAAVVVGGLGWLDLSLHAHRRGAR